MIFFMTKIHIFFLKKNNLNLEQIQFKPRCRKFTLNKKGRFKLSVYKVNLFP